MEIASDVYVGALIRRAQLGGAFAAVVHKGDARAGAMMIKVYNPRERSARLYSQALRGEGERVWIEPHPDAAESDLDAYVQRQRKYDPDLWLIEIEDGEGRHFLTEAVQT